jgi:hypothetical protein
MHEVSSKGEVHMLQYSLFTLVTWWMFQPVSQWRNHYNQARHWTTWSMTSYLHQSTSRSHPSRWCAQAFVGLELWAVYPDLVFEQFLGLDSVNEWYDTTKIKVGYWKGITQGLQMRWSGHDLWFAKATSW